MKSDVKLKVTLKVVNNQECGDVYHDSEITIDNKHLCAGGDKDYDTCYADGGSPLMDYDDTDTTDKIWYLAGISSFSATECASTGYPGVYTRVDHYIDWILSKLK